MPRPPRKSLLIEGDTWAAGVLDACGAFTISRNKHGQMYCRVRLSVSPSMAARFVLVTRARLRKDGRARWTVAGKDVLPLLSRLQIRMLVLHEEAGMVYRFALTRSRRGIGRQVSGAVVQYRTELVSKLRERRTVGKLAMEDGNGHD